MATWLESLTDAQLEAHFAPMLNFTRPDRETAAYKEEKKATVKKQKKPGFGDIDQLFLSMPDEKRAKLQQMAKEQGIDLSELI